MIRPRHPFFEPKDDAYGDVLEDVRKGTRQQYASDWVAVTANTDVDPTESFTHELGEVPWVVDVLRADDSEGFNAVQVPATDVTVAKTDSLITLTVPTSVTVTYYYQVRAM